MESPKFEKIDYDIFKGKIKDQIKAECKAEVRSDEIERVLSVSCFAFAEQTEVLDNKLCYGGKALFYISYLDKDGEVKKAECGGEFSGAIKDDGVQSGDRAFITVTTERCETSLSGASLTANAYLTVNADLSSSAQAVALSGGEDLVVDLGDSEHLKGLGVRNSGYPIEDEFELSYSASEVLSYTATAVITAAQCGVGSIIVDGEVLLSLIVLQKNDKRDIIRENKTIPFRAELDYEDAMPIMQAVARVKEKSIKIDVSVDQATNKSTVAVSINLAFQCQAFSSVSVSVAKDVFSVENEIEVETDDFCRVEECPQRHLSATVKGRAVVDELPIGAGVNALFNESVEITEKSCDQNGLRFTGVVKATAFLRDGEFNPFVKKLEMPFECSFDECLNCDEIDFLSAAVSAKGRIVSATEMEGEFDIVFTVYPTKKCNLRVVKGVKVIGAKKPQESAISVYMPQEGEDLWSLSKRLGVRPESLVNSNKELCFPLTGKERIVIYRQK
jgi:hypothetical protein